MSDNSEQNEFNKSLHLGGAVALAIGVVVGAGMLALPGLVQQEAGRYAPFVWLLNGLLVMPLLAVFAWLGRHYPSAGGIAGFVGTAFPLFRNSCGLLVFGTLSLGFPAIALTGAAYLWDGVIGSLIFEDAHYKKISVIGIAACFLGGALFSIWQGAQLAQNIQKIIIILLLSLLSLAAIKGYMGLMGGEIVFFPEAKAFLTPDLQGQLWAGMTLAFFAYTGWEMLAFTSGEFHNPKRDFPLAILFSFIIVLLLYVGVALSVMAVRNASETALLAVYATILGADFSNIFVAIMISLIIIVNLNAAAWASSRLTQNLGKQDANGVRIFPANWHLEMLSKDKNAPQHAIILIGFIVSFILLGYGLEIFSLTLLLDVAGQNFYILYLVSLLAFIKLSAFWWQKLLGSILMIFASLFLGGWAYGLIYAFILFAYPLILYCFQRKKIKI